MTKIILTLLLITSSAQAGEMIFNSPEVKSEWAKCESLQVESEFWKCNDKFGRMFVKKLKAAYPAARAPEASSKITNKGYASMSAMYRDVEYTFNGMFDPPTKEELANINQE